MKWLRFVVDFMLRFLNRNVRSEEMSRKSFHICVDFDVHAVTCPGVWLCPKGRIELRIAMLGLSVNTRPIAPSFPLLFHEKFRFHKMLRSVNSLTALQGVLKSRNLHIQLLHTTPGHSNRTRAPPSTTVLATFRSPIVDVFYPPSPAAHSLNAGTDVDLLLKPTACFPGIISPKAEISTRVVIEEVVNYCSPERVINPVTVSSKAENTADDVSPLVRQRAVCHSDSCQCCDCYKAKKTSTGQTPFLIGPLPRRPGFRPKQYKRLTKTRNRPSAVENKKYREEIPHINCNCEEPADEEEGSTVCKCILCRKYKDYFPSGDYTSSDLDNKPKPKPKKTRCKYCCGDQKEVRRQRKSSSPVKQAEDCCPCMLLNRIPIVEELGEIDNNEFNTLLKNLENHCPNCYQAEPRSITVIKSSLGPIPAGGLSDALAEQRWMGDRVSPGIQGCSCGIYSCRGRKFDESNTKKREESDRLNETNKKSFRDGRKNFYLSLEEYYRQLYARAKQRSSMEIVNTCA